MTLSIYAAASAVGLALGWFAYDLAKLAFMAVMARRRYAFSRVSSKASRYSAVHALRHPKAIEPRTNRESILPSGLATDGSK